MHGYPAVRLRRLREHAGMRAMLGRSLPGLEKFIWPVFVRPGEGGCDVISAMPGQFRYTVDRLIAALETPVRNGLGGVLLFGVPADGDKDGQGSHAADPDGVVPAAVRAVRRAYPGVLVFTDVCLCAYTDHGHCGPLDENGCVDNDRAIAQLAKVALAHAAAGAHGVAPSAMMDGQVAAIRAALDNAGHMRTILMGYSTKFASGFYGPFREAEVSSPRSGDRRGYQADYQNLRAALRESRFDEEEGADILMVKPSMLYLDVIQRLRHRTDLPIAAYNVSGEYSMLIAAAERGWGDLRGMVRENIAALARAGADIFISYWAGRYEEWRDG